MVQFRMLRSDFGEIVMPLYEYKCSACGQACEYLQKFTDPEIKLCPNCGKEALKKQVSATQFQLKGTGWYVTDFKNSDKNTPTTQETTSTTEKPEKTPKENKKGDS